MAERGWNYMNAGGGEWDVVDWPKPGDWPGTVMRSPTSKKWLASRRVEDGHWDTVVGSWPTREQAATGLIRDILETDDPLWGWCSNPECRCWHLDDSPCEEFCDGDHPYHRCARCGVREMNHGKA